MTIFERNDKGAAMPTVNQLEKLANEIWVIRGRPLNTDAENWKLAEYFQRIFEDHNMRLDKVTIGKRFSEKMLLTITRSIPRIILKFFIPKILIGMIDDRVRCVECEWVEEDKLEHTTKGV